MDQRFQVILKPELGGGFTVYVPALPGCVTYGQTLEEAKEMARDAIVGYLQSMRDHNEPLPTSDEESVITSVTVQETVHA